MRVYRTPDKCFDDLEGYPFEPSYVQVQDKNLGRLRLHFVDEGPRNGPVVIMMHGEPSWSYLYRKMIRSVASQGYRVLAPDLIGFGRSDKPSETSDYSYEKHVDWMSQWLEELGVKDVVLFCQDWGGLIGLRLVAVSPDQFSGVIAANTFLPIGKSGTSKSFSQWREFSQSEKIFPTSDIINMATQTNLPDRIKFAYDAPFPDEKYKAGARVFPLLVPIEEHMPSVAENIEAWKVLANFKKPFLTCFSDQDPVTKGLEAYFQANIPGCNGQPHEILKGGGHFLQEDVSSELSQIIVDFMKRL